MMNWRLFLLLSAIVGLIIYYLLVGTVQRCERAVQYHETRDGYNALNDGRGYRL